MKNGVRNARLATTFLVTMFLFAESSFSAYCYHRRDAFRCVEFVKNYDGDTITVKIPDVHPLFGEAINVRIRDIDAPEKRGSGPCEKEKALEAADLVHDLLSKANSIELMNIGRDKYFRILAEVIVDGRNLADILLRKNLAYPYDGETKRENYNWCP